MDGSADKKQRGARLTISAVAIVLLALPFLPLERLFGPRPDQHAAMEPAEWLLGIALVMPLALLAAGFLPSKLSGESLRRISGATRLVSWGPLLAGALLGSVLTLISFKVFQLRPMHLDSIVQLFQAKIFSAGMLTAKAPTHPEFFITQNTIFDEGKWYSQYPPGHPALLALGVLAGQPWIVPICLSLVTAWALYSFCRLVYDRTTALASLLLLLCSPFFLFMGASFMNHVSALCFLALLLLSYAHWERSFSARHSACCGLALSGVLLTRPLCALIFGTVLFLFALPALRTGRVLRSGLAAAPTLALGVIAMLYYNAQTTGEPLLSGYEKLWGSAHGLGFHASPWGEGHTFVRGLANQLFDLQLLQEQLFGWPIPCLVPLSVFLLLAARGKEPLPLLRLRTVPHVESAAAASVLRPWDLRLCALLLAVPATYLFYWHRDSYLGPRFLYSIVCCAAPLTARSLAVVTAHFRQRSFSFLSSRINLSRFIWCLLVLSVAVGLCVRTPLAFEAHRSSMQSLKVDLDARARQESLQPGVVFVAVSWGARLYSLMRGAGVSAAAAEALYQRSDHCLLQQLLDTHLPRGTTGEQLAELLVEATHQPTVQVRSLTGDPTLRLRPRVPLAPTCEDEVRYDQAGFTVYLPHLTANSPRLDGRFVYAIDLRERNQILLQDLGRSVGYLYRNGTFTPLRTPSRKSAERASSDDAS